MGFKKNLILAEELHKPVRHKFPKRRIYVKGIDDIWAADLMDVSSLSKANKGMKYILSVIDIFSKYGWLIPIKDKKGITVANALKTIFKERRPDKLWVDNGKEFYNKDVKGLIEIYSTNNEEKSSVVERWIRTMKEKMYKYFTANSTRVYIDVLQDLVHDYNNARHSTIKMTPAEASKKINENKVYSNLYPVKITKPIKPRFAVGDKVRIVKKKNIFSKGFEPRWTEEIFTIKEILYTNPPTYEIQDLNDETIEGSFYEPELQKTMQDIFRIEKVLKRRGNKLFVKWKGYPEEFNSWVNKSELN